VAVLVKIPAPLRSQTEGEREARIDASSVADCLGALARKYPGLQDRLFAEDGTVRKFINIYVKGEDIRFGDGLATELRDGDDVSIVPAASGGV
jgi:molybdopterin synthase sulfur carrier subunit